MARPRCLRRFASEPACPSSAMKSGPLSGAAMARRPRRVRAAGLAGKQEEQPATPHHTLDPKASNDKKDGGPARLGASGPRGQALGCRGREVGRVCPPSRHPWFERLPLALAGFSRRRPGAEATLPSQAVVAGESHPMVGSFLPSSREATLALGATRVAVRRPAWPGEPSRERRFGHGRPSHVRLLAWSAAPGHWLGVPPLVGYNRASFVFVPNAPEGDMGPTTLGPGLGAHRSAVPRPAFLLSLSLRRGGFIHYQRGPSMAFRPKNRTFLERHRDVGLAFAKNVSVQFDWCENADRKNADLSSRNADPYEDNTQPYKPTRFRLSVVVNHTGMISLKIIKSNNRLVLWFGVKRHVICATNMRTS